MEMGLHNDPTDIFERIISALDELGKEDIIFTFDFMKSRLLQEEPLTDMRMLKSYR